MRFLKPLLCAALLGSLPGCRGERTVTVLFTGDERGWVVPAG